MLTSIRARRRNIPAAVIAVVTGLLVSGCLLPPTSPAEIYSGDGGDPAMVGTGSGTGLAYTTAAYMNGEYGTFADFGNVPAFGIKFPSMSPTTFEFDALTNPNPLDDELQTYAPSVRFIDGRYLMMYSFGTMNHANCLGAATSSNAYSFTDDDSWYLCSPNPNEGFFDPDLFIDVNDNIWLFYADEDNAADIHQIDAQQLSSTGLGLFGSPTVLLTLADISAVTSGHNLGSNPQIENPSMTSDPYNDYDLTYSFGTYTSNSTYNTAEIPCVYVNSSCLPNYGGVIISGAGGASTVYDNTPATNYEIFAEVNGSYKGSVIRNDYGGATAAYDGNPPSLTAVAGESLPLQIAKVAPGPVVVSTYPPRVFDPEDPSLVMGVTNPATAPSPGSPIGSFYHGSTG
jgi:hypothetical protein